MLQLFAAKPTSNTLNKKENSEKVVAVRVTTVRRKFRRFHPHYCLKANSRTLVNWSPRRKQKTKYPETRCFDDSMDGGEARNSFSFATT